MPKLLLLSFLLLPLLVVPTTQAQEPPPPPIYSLLFSYSNQEVQIATLYPNADWRFQTIPGRLLYAQTPTIDAGMVMPRWTADGLKFYTTVYEPNTDRIATQIAVFDVAAGTLTPVAQVIDQRFVAEQDKVSEFVSIEAVSPDGSYLWASRLLSGQSLLVNTQSGEILQPQNICPAKVLDWLDQEVLLSCTGAQFSPPDLFTLDLASGERARTLPPPPPGAADNPLANYIYDGEFLRSGLYLVGALGSAQPSFIGVLRMDTYKSAYFEVGAYLQVSPEQNFAAYFSGQRLKRLNLDSLRVTDVGNAAVTSGQLWQGDRLSFWRTQERDGLFEILRVEAEPLRRSEHIVYQGQKPSAISFAPQGEAFALEFQPAPDQAYVEVYNAGRLVWVSDFQYPNSYVTLQPPANAPISWTADGVWLHLNYTPSLAAQIKTLSVNVESGESLTAPEERAAYMGESPDGAWWLYTTTTEVGQVNKNRLFVARRGSSEYVVLDAVAPLFYNFQFPEWASYMWSPIVGQ